VKHLVFIILAVSVYVSAKTPKLNIAPKHDSAGEQNRTEQIERLAERYDLSKYTITPRRRSISHFRVLSQTGREKQIFL
jgi:hypothetical protein